jgi:hypothetical protein
MAWSGHQSNGVEKIPYFFVPKWQIFKNDAFITTIK